MIRLKKVTKSYGSGEGATHVLKEVDLEIKKGEFVAIMGPSGSGKSTLLNIIGMLDEASSGEYYFLDQPVHKLREKYKSEMHKHHIGFIFQAYHLIDELTVYENIELPLLYLKMSGSARRKKVEEVMERVGWVLQSTIRESDVLYRHGDGSFRILLPAMAGAAASRREARSAPPAAARSGCPSAG